MAKKSGKKKKKVPQPKHDVYVIELRKAVLQEPKFAKANANCDASKVCLYVGMTGLDPDERFKNHKSGKKANRFVHEYGMYLRRKMYEGFNPMTYEKACEKEIELAEKLRKKGHAVWQK